MRYTSNYINNNYRIKVYGTTETGLKLNTLVGVSGLIALIGVDFANKFLDRAEASGKDSTTCKLRRGIAITFYVK